MPAAARRRAWTYDGGRPKVALNVPAPDSMTPESPSTAPRTQDSPWLELIVAVLLPAVVLMKLTERLGPLPTLLLALAFPLGWGAVQWVRRRKFGLMPALGLVSTLLTGGIGLMALDARWLAVKEAAVPGLIGLAVAGSTWTRYPLIRALVFNAQIFDVQRVQQALDERRQAKAFESRLRRGTWLLAGTFFFSSVMNYVLARWIVISPAGTAAFNEELGRLTLLSYPMIALPSMLMTMALLFWLARGATALTGLTLAEMLHAARDAAQR